MINDKEIRQVTAYYELSLSEVIDLERQGCKEDILNQQLTGYFAKQIQTNINDLPITKTTKTNPDTGAEMTTLEMIIISKKELDRLLEKDKLFRVSSELVVDNSLK